MKNEDPLIAHSAFFIIFETNENMYKLFHLVENVCLQQPLKRNQSRNVLFRLSCSAFRMDGSRKSIQQISVSVSQAFRFRIQMYLWNMFGWKVWQPYCNVATSSNISFIVLLFVWWFSFSTFTRPKERWGIEYSIFVVLRYGVWLSFATSHPHPFMSVLTVQNGMFHCF